MSRNGRASGESSGPRESRAVPGSAWRRFLERRRFVVDPRFQGGLLLSFLLQLLLFSAILTIAFVLPDLVVLLDPAGHAPHEVDAALRAVAPHALLWPPIVTGLVLTLLIALRTTHRIAGPLYQFRRVFESLRRGEDPGPVRVRKGDFLMSEATLLDEAVHAVVRDRKRLAELESRLGESVDADGDAEVPETVEPVESSAS